jgi:LPXTG-motif cell wall-anchored protein
MIEAKRSNKGSSIVFIIVGLILVVSLVATLYFVNQRGEIVRKEQDIAAYNKSQADKNAADEASKTEMVNVGDPNSENNSSLMGTTKASELPVTGSKNIFGELLGLGLVAATTAGYFSSRRNLSRYL